MFYLKIVYIYTRKFSERIFSNLPYIYLQLCIPVLIISNRQYSWNNSVYCGYRTQSHITHTITVQLN